MFAPARLLALLGTVLPVTGSTAVVTSTWSGGADPMWGTAANWTPAVVPNNNATDTYEAVVPASGFAVVLDTTATVDRLELGATSAVDIDNGRTLIIRDRLANDGILTLDAAGLTTTLGINDSSGDGIVSFSGSGTVAIDGANGSIFGAVGNRLENGPGHTIAGGGALGANTIDLTNRGTITADDPANPLTIDPRTVLLLDGGVIAATGGSSVLLEAGDYSATNGGSCRVGDGSVLELRGAQLANILLVADDADADPSNNRVSVPAAAFFTNATNATALGIADGATLTVRAGRFTNHGTVSLLSAGHSCEMSFIDPAGDQLLIDGTGVIVLDGPDERITGTVGHTLTHGAGHTIEGAGAVGAGQLRLVNHGTISANLPGGTLGLDTPAGTAVTNTGTLEAVGGGSLRSLDDLTQSGGFLAIDTTCEAHFGTIVQWDGTTIVDGLLTTPHLDLAGGGLSGHGTIAGDLTAASATVAPGSVLGTLAVDGDTTLAAGAVLAIDLGDPVTTDLFTVSGMLALDGATLRLQAPGSLGFIPNDHVVIVSAGTISGGFANAPDGGRLAVDGTSLSFRVDYLGSTIILSAFGTGTATNEDCVAELLTGPGGPFPGETDPSVIGALADPDRDGIANIFELWWGSAPGAPDGGPPVVIGNVPGDGIAPVSINIPVAAGADDVLLIGAEASFDLATWRDLSATRTVLSDDGTTRVVRFLDEPYDPARPMFFRFRADAAAVK